MMENVIFNEDDFVKENNSAKFLPILLEDWRKNFVERKKEAKQEYSFSSIVRKTIENEFPEITESQWNEIKDSICTNFNKKILSPRTKRLALREKNLIKFCFSGEFESFVELVEKYKEI